MTRFGWFFVALAAALGVLFGWVRIRHESGAASARAIVNEPEKHLVTTIMLKTAASMASQDAPLVSAPANDGNIYSLDGLVKQGPIALVFIKDGCPCSEAAQPYYNQLCDAYGERVRFFGVIDGDVEVAKRWAIKNRARFPLLCDPSLQIAHHFKAENSAYLALVAKGGKIEECWPGYSGKMLDDACVRLAQLAGIARKTIDVKNAPDEMYTGCPF